MTIAKRTIWNVRMRMLLARIAPLGMQQSYCMKMLLQHNLQMLLQGTPYLCKTYYMKWGQGILIRVCCCPMISIECCCRTRCKCSCKQHPVCVKRTMWNDDFTLLRLSLFVSLSLCLSLCLSRYIDRHDRSIDRWMDGWIDRYIDRSIGRLIDSIDRLYSVW